MKTIDLSQVPLSKLESEIERRKNEARPDVSVPWCDTCAWFPFIEPGGEQVPTEICLKRQKMEFKMPDGPLDEEWGFFKLNCKHSKYKQPE